MVVVTFIDTVFKVLSERVLVTIMPVALPSLSVSGGTMAS